MYGLLGLPYYRITRAQKLKCSTVETMAFFSCRLLIRSLKSANKKLKSCILSTARSCCWANIRSVDVGYAVMVTAEAPARPRSWRGTVPIGRRACPRTSWRQPDWWGRWRRPRWSPARPRGSGGRSTSPGNRADPGPAYCQLGGRQRGREKESIMGKSLMKNVSLFPIWDC